VTVQVARLPALLRKAQRQGWKKWIRSEADEQAVLNGCYFDTEAAEHVVEFFPRFLRHSKGQWAGQPFELLDWQRDDIVMPLFGWKKEDGWRRFNFAWIEIPKKNGKSTFGAGLGLYLLSGDGEHGAEVYSVANDRKQAGIVHEEAIRMVKASRELSQDLKIHGTTFTITCPELNSYYRALSGDADSNEGLNIHGCIADEIHSWHGRKFYDALRYGMSSRMQPLFAIITTAGSNPQSVAKELHDYAAGVLAGTQIDQRFFAYIRAADPKDDPLDEQTWRKANPSFGLTINPEIFAADAQEAAARPTSLAAFKRYRLNIWNTGESPAVDIEKWNENRRDYTAGDLREQSCFGGLDLAKVSDTTSLQLLFPQDDGTFKTLSFFWLPESRAREQNDLVSWLAWEERGFVFLTPGDVCDYGFIRKFICGLYDAAGNLLEEGLVHQFDIRGIAYDPYNAEQLTQQIEEEGGVPRHLFPQTMKQFAEPTGEFERLLIAGQLHHNGHPAMNWQVGNMQFKHDASGNKRPVKPEPKDFRKIDGPVALIMAIGLHNSGGYLESAYDEPVEPGDTAGWLI